MDGMVFQAQAEVGETFCFASRVGDVENGDLMLLLGALEQVDEI
jgi:hypothetical protein